MASITSYVISDPAGMILPGDFARRHLAEDEADALNFEHEADLIDRGLDASGWGGYAVGARLADGTIHFDAG